MKLLVLLSFLLLISCKQDPYPEGGNLVVETREEQRVVREAFSLSNDDIIEFTEGRLKKVKIIAAVEEPGEAIVTIDNIPEGANFDPENSELSWLPKFSDADDASNPRAVFKDYKVVFEVASTIDTNIEKRRFERVLRVRNNARPIIITRDENDTVFEGQTLRSVFTIENLDFPQGPFKVTLNDFPTNAELIKISDVKYAVIYAPDHEVVPIDDYTRGRRDFEGKLEVTNPRLDVSTLDFDIRVRDVRLDANLVPPSKVTQGLDVSLQVVAYDLNKEVAPLIKLTSNRPNYGEFKTELIESRDSSSSLLNITWTNIPPIHNGKTIRLEYEACVLSENNVRNRCVRKRSEVEIVLRDRNPPRIDRRLWPVGEIIYVGFNEEVSRSITVTDAEDYRLQPKVEIFPKEVRRFVKWRNGRVVITRRNKEAGIFQFNVVATSDYRVSSSESFLIEVFPENRKKVLFFADSTRDPEALFYRKQFDAQMMNPSIQEVTKRNISDRETLIITTSTLFDKTTSETLMRAIDAIPNVVIASPLIDSLPETFLRDLRDNYDLDVIGRYSDIARNPLDQMQFATTSQFKKPNAPIMLQGQASSESMNPMIFNGGLYDREKICKGVLGLTPDGNNPLVIGVVCDRQGGKKGRISLMGTEWADLKTQENDALIPEEWFKTMIQGTF